jgi:hypothetical protein
LWVYAQGWIWLVEDIDKTTVIAILSTPSDKGTLTIEIPRHILDYKIR